MGWTIKHVPKDFVVREELSVKPSSSGRYILIHVHRINMDHGSMLETISRILRVDKRNIGFAGIKDKRAVVSQYITIPKNRIRKEMMRDLSRGISNGSISLSLIGFIDSDLDSSMIRQNSFEIVLRNIEDEEIIGLQKIKNNIRGLFIPNYFDDQRFSSKNIEIGKTILQKRFRDASKMIGGNEDGLLYLKTLPKWLLRLYTNSLQSWIWNLALSRIIERVSGNNVSIIINNHEFLVPLQGINIKELSLPGYGLTDNYSDLLLEVMREQGIRINDCIVRAIPFASLESLPRKTKIEINNFNIEKINEGIKIYLSIPSGSYATIVVKSLEAILKHSLSA